MTYEHRVAALVEEGRVVLRLAIESQVPGMVDLVVLKVTLGIGGGRGLASDMCVVVRDGDGGRAGSGGESDGSEGEEMHYGEVGEGA